MQKVLYLALMESLLMRVFDGMPDIDSATTHTKYFFAKQYLGAVMTRAVDLVEATHSPRLFFHSFSDSRCSLRDISLLLLDLEPW